MLERPFYDIDEGDLLNLVENEVSEKRTIEYKLDLPSDTHESKKEFLADVSSFANASGGHLIFGVREEGGTPSEIPGISGIDPDQVILRLENLLRDSIDPRLQGVSIKNIPLNSGANTIIIRIPRSWTGPHVVKFGRHWRFYSRNSAGKYPLDVSEVRSAFLQSEGLTDRIRSFRDVRIGSISAAEMPVSLIPGARTVLHLIPFISFEPATAFPISEIANDPWSLKPISNSVTSHRYNIDGFLTNGGDEAGLSRGYVQVFRNGIIEAVDAGILRDRSEGCIIPSVVFERKLVASLGAYFNALNKMSVPAPISVIVTLMGVSGYYMAVKQSLDPWGEHTKPIDRDVLLLPEIIVEGFPNESSQVLRPIFDAVWNATGWARSLNYNEEGEWQKGINWGI